MKLLMLDIQTCFSRCPLKKQNYDYLVYVLTALYHESLVSVSFIVNFIDLSSLKYRHWCLKNLSFDCLNSFWKPVKSRLAWLVLTLSPNLSPTRYSRCEYNYFRTSSDISKIMNSNLFSARKVMFMKWFESF